MEFKFRSNNGQPPMYRSQSSTFTYFTEQAMRAGYANNLGRHHEFLRTPNNVRESIQRELEKDRIRQEIIAGEIARRRVLEAEVRRELMMEKEMAFRRSDGFPFVPQASHRQQHLHQQEGRSFEERIALSLEERLGQPLHRDIGRFEMVPVQSQWKPQIEEITPVSEVDKNKIIILGKPNTSITGVKRKTSTPPIADGSELALVGSKKQPKNEWSCAICQVSATNEAGLNEHLEGKKHKSKEAALRAQKMGQNFGIGVAPKKKIPVPIKLVETSFTPNPAVQKNEKKKKPLLLKFKQKPDVSKTGGDEKMEGSRKSKFKFWCEMCQAGAFSEKVMNIHRRGKKHARNLELKSNGGATQISQTAGKKQSKEVAEEEIMMAKDSIVVAMSEEATNIEVSQEIAKDEIKTISENADEVENKAHLESQEVADTLSV